MNLALPWPFGRGAKLEKPRKDEEEVAQLEQLGVTPQLLDFVKDFTIDTFRNFPLKGPHHHNDCSSFSLLHSSEDLTEMPRRQWRFILLLQMIQRRMVMSILRRGAVLVRILASGRSAMPCFFSEKPRCGMLWLKAGSFFFFLNVLGFKEAVVE